METRNLESLRVTDLSYYYKKEHPLFENLSFALKQGECKAIVGASGSGKSTLFSLILGHLQPVDGKITLNAKSAQVYQDPFSSFHPSYTIYEQINEVVSSMGDVQIYADALGLKLSLLDKKVHELSGGQLQRASIVRALLMRPNLLLLDEPTSAMDNILQLQCMQLLMKQLDKMAILIITHELDLAQWASDEIITLGAK